MSASNTSATAKYFKLGLFTLIAVALLVAGVIVLGAGALFQHSVPAESLVYDSVNGLDVGAAVKYRGVPIGKVSALRFAYTKYPEAADIEDKEYGRDIRGVLIEMEISEHAFPGESPRKMMEVAARLVARGLRARVTPAGLGGQSYVEFDILNPDDFPPPAIHWKPDELYIPSAPGTIGRVLDAAGHIASELEKAHLGEVVHHIDELAQQATAAVNDIKQVIGNNRQNLDKTLAELPETAAKLKETAARADEILHDPRVDKAIDGLAGTGQSIDKALADVRRLLHEAEQLLSGESDDIRSIITDLKRVASDGAAFMEDARANPSRVLFGKPPPESTNEQPNK